MTWLHAHLVSRQDRVPESGVQTSRPGVDKGTSVSRERSEDRKRVPRTLRDNSVSRSRRQWHARLGERK